MSGMPGFKILHQIVEHIQYGNLQRVLFYV